MKTDHALVTNAKRWWGGPGGGREVLALAIPLVISTSSWTLMQFIDRVFLLWHSDEALAAALPAGMLSFALECFFLGIAAYVNTFVAQYHGASQPRRIGVAVWQGVLLGAISAPMLLLTAPLAPKFFAAVGHAPTVQRLEVTYYTVLCYGGGAIVISAALSSFFTGRGTVRTVMIVDSLAALLNALLDYAWIFGHWGLPAAGIAGAAGATVVALWFRVFVYLGLFLLPRYRAKYQTIAGCRFDPDLFWRLIRFGNPAGLQLLFEAGAYTAFLMLVGRLGSECLAATNLALNVNSLAFVPMLGFGMAVTTLVGQRLGENRPEVAARGTWNAYWMATLYMGTIAAFYVLTPQLFLYACAADLEPHKFAQLAQTTTHLLRFVAAYCLFDTMNIIFVGALKGAGDTRFIFNTNAVMSVMPVAATWIGLNWFGLGLYFSWTVITTWVMVLGAIYLFRFVQGKWREMRVIEIPPLSAPSISLAPVMAGTGEVA